MKRLSKVLPLLLSVLLSVVKPAIAGTVTAANNASPPSSSTTTSTLDEPLKSTDMVQLELDCVLVLSSHPKYLDGLIQMFDLRDKTNWYELTEHAKCRELFAPHCGLISETQLLSLFEPWEGDREGGEGMDADEPETKDRNPAGRLAKFQQTGCLGRIEKLGMIQPSHAHYFDKIDIRSLKFWSAFMAPTLAALIDRQKVYGDFITPFSLTSLQELLKSALFRKGTHRYWYIFDQSLIPAIVSKPDMLQDLMEMLETVLTDLHTEQDLSLWMLRTELVLYHFLNSRTPLALPSAKAFLTQLCDSRKKALDRADLIIPSFNSLIHSIANAPSPNCKSFVERIHSDSTHPYHPLRNEMQKLYTLLNANNHGESSAIAPPSSAHFLRVATVGFDEALEASWLSDYFSLYPIDLAVSTDEGLSILQRAAENEKMRFRQFINNISPKDDTFYPPINLFRLLSLALTSGNTGLCDDLFSFVEGILSEGRSVNKRRILEVLSKNRNLLPAAYYLLDNPSDFLRVALKDNSSPMSPALDLSNVDGEEIEQQRRLKKAQERGDSSSQGQHTEGEKKSDKSTDFSSAKADELYRKIILERSFKYALKNPENFRHPNLHLLVDRSIDDGGPLKGWLRSLQETLIDADRGLFMPRNDDAHRWTFAWLVDSEVAEFVGMLAGKLLHSGLSFEFNLDRTLIHAAIDSTLEASKAYYDATYVPASERHLKKYFYDQEKNFSALEDVTPMPFPDDITFTTIAKKSNVLIFDQEHSAKWERLKDYEADLDRVGRGNFERVINSFVKGLDHFIHVEEMRYIRNKDLIHETFNPGPLTAQEIINHTFYDKCNGIEVDTFVPGKKIPFQEAFGQLVKALEPSQLSRLVVNWTGGSFSKLFLKPNTFTVICMRSTDKTSTMDFFAEEGSETAPKNDASATNRRTTLQSTTTTTISTVESQTSAPVYAQDSVTIFSQEQYTSLLRKIAEMQRQLYASNLPSGSLDPILRRTYKSGSINLISVHTCYNQISLVPESSAALIRALGMFLNIPPEYYEDPMLRRNAIQAIASTQETQLGRVFTNTLSFDETRAARGPQMGHEQQGSTDSLSGSTLSNPHERMQTE